CEVEVVCRESLRLVREAAQRKDLDIQLDVSSTARVVLADPLRLKQILVNLLSNSVKFTRAGGQLGIDVTTDRAEERVNFTVWDTGIGIAEVDFPRLFRPFVQLDGGLARKHSGAGLGLSLVRRLAEMHGGGVRVESSPGRGSRFIVVLPNHAETVSGDERDDYGAAEDASNSRGGRHLLIPACPTHVLLVEDNQLNATVTKRLLGSLGYRVTIAADGWSALRHVVEDHPNIVLMDVQMSGMDGLETTRRIRANPQSETLPIVALTALAMPGDRQRCLAAGMNEYLSKPTSRKILHDVIESFVSFGVVSE
ncbi:MAG: ATP-binding protein, partial [Gammaproteobacteria bacterium]|nr:ATP-binding protein [Gammaproteobacteria bacterium]